MTSWQQQQGQYSYHDAVCQRLALMPPFVVYTLDAATNIVPWMTVSAQTILPELLISPHEFQAQIDVCGAQIAFWGRLEVIGARVAALLGAA